MLYEFALTPDIFCKDLIQEESRASEILVDLLQKLLISGLLAEFQGTAWRKTVFERVDSLPQQSKKKIQTLLTTLKDRNRLVRHPKQNAYQLSTDEDWLRLILDGHKLVPFHGIVLQNSLLNKNFYNDDALIEFFSIKESMQWDNLDRRTVTVEKTHHAYRNAMEPILRHAKSVKLVDPYLNPTDQRFIKTVDSCSELLGKRRYAKASGFVEIHTGTKQDATTQDNELRLNQWIKELKSLKDRDGHSFEVFLWNQQPGKRKMHDRFLLTNQCGFSVPWGFDHLRATHDESSDWSLLDYEVYIKRWNQYSSQSTSLDLFDKRKID